MHNKLQIWAALIVAEISPTVVFGAIEYLHTLNMTRTLSPYLRGVAHWLASNFEGLVASSSIVLATLSVAIVLAARADLPEWLERKRRGQLISKIIRTLSTQTARSSREIY